MAQEGKPRRIAVHADTEDDVVIQTGCAPEAEKAPAETHDSASDNAAASAGNPVPAESAVEPEPAPEPAPAPKPKKAAERDDEYETTLEDLENTKMPLMQKVIIVVAIVAIIAFIVWYQVVK